MPTIRRCVLVWFLSLITGLPIPGDRTAQGEEPVPGRTERADLYGDPLPTGALARVGTVRFRTGNSIMAVRFSPDGKALASVGHDAVFLWDLRTGKPLRRWQGRPSFYRGAYAPDGRKLWLQTYEGAISVWDLSTQPDRGPVAAQFKGPLTGFLAISPDSKLLAAGNKNVIRVFDIATAKEIRRLAGDGPDIHSATFSADGKLLASQATRGSIVLWDVQTGKELRSFPPDRKTGVRERFRLEDTINGFALAPDGKIIALSFYGENGPIRLWDTATGKELRTIRGSEVAGRGMIFSPDGKMLAMASQNGLRLWEAATGKELWQIPVQGNQVFSIAFSPDGRTLAAGLVSMIRLWDVATGRELCPIPEHRDGVGFAFLTADGRTVITEGQAVGGVPGSGGPAKDVPSLRYWDAATGQQLVGPDQHFPPLADLSADARTLAAWGQDKKVQVWDLATGKEVRRIPYEDEVAACRLSSDGKVLLLGSREPKPSVLDAQVKLQLWDVSTGNELGQLANHQGLLWATEFSPDGKLLATVDDKNKTVHLWEVATRRKIHIFTTGERGVRHIAFSPDGRILAGGGIDPVIYLWDTAAGKELPKLSSKPAKEKLASGVYALAFFSDAKTLITTDNFGKVFFWDTATGDLRLEWQAHQFRVSLLALSANGKILLTRGATTALVWDVDKLLKKK